MNIDDERLKYYGMKSAKRERDLIRAIIIGAVVGFIAAIAVVLI